MFINYGSSNTSMPDQKNHQIKAIPMHRALMASLPGTDLPPYSYVKIAVFTSTKTSMKLKANVRSDGV
jgi:hypothetical protein